MTRGDCYFERRDDTRSSVCWQTNSDESRHR